ncbi:GATA transcription factor 8-like [Salvia miltiorrhiza]|uniref:GATA transcription factor 8-like n=1 Tax=Salvia miltiorrhiza TaxID=226208 RepID=UPI0025ABB583|nr:GATA transcription factor 8-like [Salvia miltiorrhiza]XP_057784634.1 GATA transcription factor 8-like [Salvia miltiorrhiza]XP_057784635.1 GATA transcription factor 8-like [Salvia miltiorrhiza]XP_057784636.1 GATA transcription factor 8-like [Salvia miltiorrhiza]XP_057784637.1 GATA transcription factor 8-like [Salvia miltiorrhiza]
MGPNLVDEIDCANFFDQIDDLIEFPPDNECGGGAGGVGAGDFVSSGDSKDFPSMWSDTLPETDLLFASGGSASDLSAELSVPYEDIVQLEWLSTFVEDSFSGGGMTIAKESSSIKKEPSHNQFHTSSPVSVLESSSSSSSSCSGGKTMPLSPTHRGPQRARSKRPRPATFNPRAAIQLLSPSPSSVEAPPKFVPTGFSSKSENFAESPPTKVPKPAGAEHKKKKKIKITLTANQEETHEIPQMQQAVRKCMHCEITKTPQWRAGPMGPKSLCNACGVRYKSGRLFPEYRPAASPTFVPSLHSNSHKKVVEMRTKFGGGATMTTPTTSEPEHAPNP